jgi:hypothetical protein
LICWISTRTARWIKLSLSCLRDLWGKNVSCSLCTVASLDKILSLRIGPALYGADVLETGALFKKYDLNADGRIDFNEFKVLVEEGLKKSA